MHFYRVHGISVRSDWLLPELEEMPPPQSGEADLRVLVEETNPEDGDAGRTQYVDSTFAKFFVVNVGCYEIRDGNGIHVKTIASADPAAVRLFLLGSAMGIAFHQRGMLPLHASAIEIRGKVVAFVGEQGEGKSTLAAHCLASCDARLVSDDTLIVSFDQSGVPSVHAGIPAIKLWRDALDRLGKSTDELRAEWFRATKFQWPRRDRSVEGPLPLFKVFVLSSDETAGAGQIAPVHGFAAALALIDHTYRVEFLEEKTQRAHHFSACVRLAKEVSVYRFSRARNPEMIDETARMILSAV